MPVTISITPVIIYVMRDLNSPITVLVHTTNVSTQNRRLQFHWHNGNNNYMNLKHSSVTGTSTGAGTGAGTAAGTGAGVGTGIHV